MAKTFFIAGTDTDVGKTLTASALLAKARQMGSTTAAIKPVAAGCEQTEDGLRNADALALMAQCSVAMPYEQVNPIALLEPIAPHIAAAKAGRSLNPNLLAGLCRGVMSARADLTLIEGAGGWRVPLNDRHTLADVARELNQPVILVVGMKLGCINHALLTAEAIARDGLMLAGWVACRTQPEMAVFDENLATLGQRLAAPLLGVIPYLDAPTAEHAAKFLDIGPLEL